MAKKQANPLALVAIAFALIVVGGAVVQMPSATPEYDLSINPFGSLPNDTIGVGGGQCDDFGSLPAVDDDGDGVANQFDASCIALFDQSGNGICDTRVWDGSVDEVWADYAQYTPASPCTGWE